MIKYLILFSISIALSANSLVDSVLSTDSQEPVAYQNKTDLYIGFWGTTRPGAKHAANDSYANAVLNRIQKSSGPFKMYFQAEGDKVMNELLNTIDINKNKQLDAYEINQFRVHLMGFSWGAITAIESAEFLAQKSKRILAKSTSLGHANRQFDLYEISINSMLLLDPILLLKQKTDMNEKLVKMTIPQNVNQFRVFYQSKGGNAIFYSNKEKLTMGTFLSRRLIGQAIMQKRASINNPVIDVNKESSMMIKTTLGYRNYRLEAKDVNHDALPVFVERQVLDFLKSPYSK